MSTPEERNVENIWQANNSIVSSRKAVTTAGTRVQLSATSVRIKGLMISGDLGNTGEVVVGDNSVVATQGAMVGNVIIPGNAPFVLPVNDLNLVWIDANTNGDGICFTYFSVVSPS